MQYISKRLEGYTFILSDETIDRHGERILLDGISIENFKKNPVCFFNHDSYSKPVARWVNIRKENGQLLADLEFAEDIIESQEIKKYIDSGLINSVSIGFKALKTTTERIGGKSVLVYTKSELIEASLVPIPANPNAIRIKGYYIKEIEVNEGIMNIEVEHEKAGAVLNKTNKQKLLEAMALIDSVVGSAVQEEQEEQNKYYISEDELFNIINY